MPGRFEELWGLESAEGGFVVSSLPFFARGLAFGDLVLASPPEFNITSIVKRSHLFTLRACFTSKAHAASSHEAVHEALIRLGLPFEWRGSGYFAVLLRAAAEAEVVLAALASVVPAGGLSSEVEPPAEA